MENNHINFVRLTRSIRANLVGSFIFLILLSSCTKNVLDTEPLGSFSETSVWNDPSLINTYINNTYRVLPHGFTFATRRIFCLTDEAEANGWEEYGIIKSGNLTPSSAALSVINYWTGSGNDPGYYKCITQCNIFLEKITEATFDEVLKNRMIGEIKTLRAYSYFMLISFYGGVPLITKPFTLNDKFDLPRDTYAKCFDFVIAELDEAISLLPLNYDAVNQGRISKGAAMSIKSRALLYAASPLNNPSNDQTKWQKAADAAKAVIDLNKYQLYPDYKGMFMASAANNSEMIWVRPFNHNVDDESIYLELRLYPLQYKGYKQILVLDNIVQQYETLNGKLPKDDPTYNPQDPYINRDPRFYATILYYGATFKGVPSEQYDAAASGYYLRKYIDESITNPSRYICTDPSWVFFRYAEILLNYAEAEYNLGDEETCREYINMVRSRPGVNMPPVTESGPILLERLQNERCIELAFEGHRYFDPRRWKTAPQVFTGPINGMRVTKDLITGIKTYTIFKILDANFTEKMYLAPIPQSEIEKDAQLEQNPGY